MAEQNLNVKIIQRNDTAANWTSRNPILLKGEMGFETDTNKMKIGNGSTTWNNLDYLGIHTPTTAQNKAKLVDVLDEETQEYAGEIQLFNQENQKAIINHYHGELGFFGANQMNVNMPIYCQNVEGYKGTFNEGVATNKLAINAATAPSIFFNAGRAKDSSIRWNASPTAEYGFDFKVENNLLMNMTQKAISCFKDVMLNGNQLKAGRTNYNGPLLRTYDGDVDGIGLQIQAGGLTVIGGGESAQNYFTNLPDGGDAKTENLALVADTNIILRSGVQGGFSDDKKITMDSNGRFNLNASGLTFPTTAGQWISGKTTNSVFNITGSTAAGYHPIMRYNMTSGSVANLGAFGDWFGFWGYLPSQTENGTSAGAYLDIPNNRWVSKGAMNVGNSSGNVKRTTISASNPSGGANGDVWFKYS